MKLGTLIKIFRYFYDLEGKMDEVLCRLNAIEEEQRLNKPYLTKKEAATYLGKTSSYVDKLIRGREISYFQPNGYAIFIARDELDRYITRTRFLSEEQIKARSRRNA